MAAALAVMRQHLSPLAQQHPELQPQLKAALALLVPLPSAAAGGSSTDIAAAKHRQQAVSDALAVRAWLAGCCLRCASPLWLCAAGWQPCSIHIADLPWLLPCMQALRAALHPRCHVREPRLLGLLRDLLRWVAHCPQRCCVGCGV